MEHRCGTRVVISMPVRLVVPSGAVVTGRIENLSPGGAFVAVPVQPPVWTRLVVELLGPQPESPDTFRVPAYVVRQTEMGVGLEWNEFAPWPILKLLRYVSNKLYSSSSCAKWSERIACNP